MALLAIDGNAKTVKGQKFGVLTGILYLAPNTQSGVMNVCANAKAAQCEKPCLYTAGRGRFNNVQQGRIRKTVYLFERPAEFMNELARDVAKVIAKARKADAVPMIRLNGTSDILWERKPVTIDEKTATYLTKYHGMSVSEGDEYPNIMSLFPDVQFYDYTKIAGRFAYDLPANYDLTFSYSGVETYRKQVDLAIKHKARMAVVFRTPDDVPNEFMGMPVVDGDEHDIRPFNPQASIVALIAKGDAKTDYSGFVVGA
jgi:hypothetical protein